MDFSDKKLDGIYFAVDCGSGAACGIGLPALTGFKRFAESVGGSSGGTAPGTVCLWLRRKDNRSR